MNNNPYYPQIQDLRQQQPNPAYNPPYMSSADYFTQQRMNNISNFQQPQQPQPQQPVNQIICKPVNGVDDVNTARIDALNTYLFADYGANKIYLKQIGNDGRAYITTYIAETAQQPQNQAATPQPTQQAIPELSVMDGQIKALVAIMQNMQNKISEMEGKFNGFEGTASQFANCNMSTASTVNQESTTENAISGTDVKQKSGTGRNSGNNEKTS